MQSYRKPKIIQNGLKNDWITRITLEKEVNKEKMKAKELQGHLQSLRGEWLYPADTVDTFKTGSPETEIQGIAVGWMSYTWALERGLKLGCNVFITHEPTFYDHFDRDPSIFRFPHADDKRRFIENNGLVVIRCHDLWDRLPAIGISDTWGSFLGFGPPIGGNEHMRVYDAGGSSALEIAKQVAIRVKRLGQEAVQMIGPGDKCVNRICTGTGAITPFFTFLEELDADLAICTDDGLWYWRDGAYAIDAGIPLLVVNHAVSEEAGMISLAHHLRSQFPNVPVHHIPQQCMYRLVVG